MLLFKSAIGLTALTKRTYDESTDETQTNIKYGWILITIKNELWCCAKHGIIIYKEVDTKLMKVRKIKFGDNWIISVTDLGDSVAAATSGGLFVLQYTGTATYTIIILLLIKRKTHVRI